MTNDNSIMKFEEVMAYLDIGKSTLYTLLRNGDIQSFKIGKTWKIPRKAYPPNNPVTTANVEYVLK